jgi:hypothetical protein
MARTGAEASGREPLVAGAASDRLVARPLPRVVFGFVAEADGSAVSVLASTSGWVVSRVYGSSGNSGATLKNDFIEVYNAGAAAASLAGWSVQPASATGATWRCGRLQASVLGVILSSVALAVDVGVLMQKGQGIARN